MTRSLPENSSITDANTTCRETGNSKPNPRAPAIGLMAYRGKEYSPAGKFAIFANPAFRLGKGYRTITPDPGRAPVSFRQFQPKADGVSTSHSPQHSFIEKNRIFIRSYQPDDKNRIIQLLNAPSIKSTIWDWQFDSPCLDTTTRPIVASDKWNNILGFNGMMPVPLDVRGFGPVKAAWSCDFFVSGEARGRGVGKKIKQELKHQSAAMFALGTSATAAVVLQQSGWVPFTEVYSFRSGSPPTPRRKTPQDTLLTELPPAPQVDALWASVKYDYNAAVSRNFNYLHWRYQQSPIARYHYLPHYEQGELKNLAVLFEASDYVVLVDYIGPRNDVEAKTTILRQLMQLGKAVRCTTSCTEWQAILSLHHFKRSAVPINCFIYANDPALKQAIAEDFYLMTGDCDGDILSSSIEAAKIGDQSALADYSITRVTRREFAALKEDWDQLLGESANNNLFLSWNWVHTWWKTFSDFYSFEFCLLACWHHGRLVGLAPLYFRHYRRFGIGTRQLQIMGCSWSGPNTFRSEYLDFIVSKAFDRPVRAALLDYIFRQLKWDEFVLGDTPHESLTTRMIEECYGHEVYLRNTHRDYSVRVPVEIEASEYLGRLSGNLRRNAFNMYEQLEKEFDCKEIVYNSVEQCRFDIVETLNNLHQPRWGKPCFQGLSRVFHNAIIEQFSHNNHILINTLEVEGKPISLAYNLLHDRAIYNIQLGFSVDQRFARYSLGLLQLGRSILVALNSKRWAQFDMLAGLGKQEYYKSRFGGHHYHIETKQYLRASWLVFLYKVYDLKNRDIVKRLYFWK